jgi:hypothetical protein
MIRQQLHADPAFLHRNIEGLKATGVLPGFHRETVFFAGY